MGNYSVNTASIFRTIYLYPNSCRMPRKELNIVKSSKTGIGRDKKLPSCHKLLGSPAADDFWKCLYKSNKHGIHVTFPRKYLIFFCCCSFWVKKKTFHPTYHKTSNKNIDKEITILQARAKIDQTKFNIKSMPCIYTFHAYLWSFNISKLILKKRQRKEESESPRGQWCDGDGMW